MTSPVKEKKARRGITSAIPVKRPMTEETVEDIENGEIPANYDEIAARQAVADMEKLAEFQQMFDGQQYHVRVERFNKEENEMEMVDKILFQNFDPYAVGKKYGGGRFICTILNPKGRYVEGGRFHFNFAKTEIVEKAAAPPDPMQSPMIVMMLENMRQDKLALMELMKTMATGEKQAPIDQLVNALKGLHDMGPKDKSESPLKNLKEFMELQALFQDRNGGNDSGGGWLSDAKEALKILVETRGAKNETPPAPPMITGGVPIMRRAAPNTMATLRPKEGEPVSDPVMTKIRFYLPEFESAARENADPSKWASFLIEVLESQIVPLIVKKYWGVVDADEVWEKLIDAARDAGKVAKIYEFSPVLNEYQPWVSSVLFEAVAQFEGEAVEPVNGAQE